MFICQADQLEFSYPQTINPVFTDLSFVITNQARIGVVGDNGAGKSTLLSLLRGAVKPCAGQLLWGAPVQVGWLSQQPERTQDLDGRGILWREYPELYHINTQLKNIGDPNFDWELFDQYQQLGGYQLEAKTQRILDKLELCELHLEKSCDVLSGGEQTRLALGSLLLSEPGLLLLDEPGNHLDLQGIAWLERFLAKCTIPYLMVSHDRHLLDRCCTSTWHLVRGKLISYQGCFSDYQQCQQKELAAQSQQWQQGKQQAQRLEQQHRRKQQQSERMQRFKASRSVKSNGGLCKRDDGSVKGSANPERVARQAKVLGRRVERIKEQQANSKPWQEKQRTLQLLSRSEIRCRSLLRVEHLGFSHWASPLIKDLSFILKPGDRLYLEGKNASGKSTLLALLSGQLTADSGAVRPAQSATLGYLPQQFGMGEARSLRQRVKPTTRQLEQQLMTQLASLGLEKGLADKADHQLSEGQRLKCRLIELLLAGRIFYCWMSRPIILRCRPGISWQNVFASFQEPLFLQAMIGVSLKPWLIAG
ncbi:ATP-binding cassette domain-containing protein [Dongshaea marina]|uniref:ATP-binding cassette domain-containing protein n=1 Tax=Dongshaea marina TaxID=2047966 RepID=UPI000D3EB2B8|nr:ATP-binding cassette domain-containing protein [Dongshaea marina]